MGFSWSFWIVQELVLNICREAGIPSEQILVSSWPAPSLEQGVVANPYCDNLNLFGFDKSEVNDQLRRLMAGFRKYGFELHEIEWAWLLARPLGSEFNGCSSILGPRVEKMLALRSACRWLQAGRRVSGRQLQIVVGLLTHEFLYHRSAFSIFRAAYTFIQDSFHTRQPLWASVARESLK